MSASYSDILREGLQKAYAVAEEARSKGYDPSDDIEVRIAKDIAARVEGIVGPPGVADLIRGMETNGMAREDIAFEVARKIAAGEVIKANKELLIEQAVRTGLGILTEGVLVAPTEGIAKVRIKQNPDGSDYVAVYYSGPIRSAGGTAVALSLVLADIARRICGVGDYRATDTQVMRYIEEINTYETRCVHLQYLPPEDDIKVIVSNCPICVDGEPTEEIEVSAYRSVPGVETNRVRGGVPLVVCDGVALKAAKLFKYTKKLKLGWDWLEKIIKIKRKEDKIEIKPDSTYLEGLVAGRPVFAHASAKGGFRLRYGRSKTTSLMAKNIHPATMILLDNFLAYGTHMKIERPGKGCVVAAHEGLEPPVVKLADGRVMKVRTLEEAYAIKKDVVEVLFLGDLLTTYGDFLKSNHPLMPSGYCEEWWQREVEAKGLPLPGAMDAPSCFAFSKLHGVPLHPDFTYPWHDISPEQLRDLAQWLRSGHLEMDGSRIRSLRLPESPAKRVLEELLVEHRTYEGHIIIGGDDAYTLLGSLGALAEDKLDFTAFDKAWSASKKPLDLVNEFIKTRAKAPTYIGARMGRPEKAKERAMDGSPTVLFPTGSFKNRSLSKQYRMVKGVEGAKTINIEVARMRCRKCNRLTFYRRCDVCGGQAIEERVCQKCGRAVSTDIHCDFKTLPYDVRPVDIVELFESVKSRLGINPEEVKGVKGLANATRLPERLEKGFLRSKHGVFVFRDGTSRFDATDIPLTHFTPAEIGTDVEKLRNLGYERDYLGNDLRNPDQTLALRHQDIILSNAGAEYFLKVANFIDDLLVNLYGLKSFYNLRSREDLVGHLAVGLSPHTSAGVLCRIIGFTRANVGYGHPYFHTAKRRNCFHPDTEILIWDGKSNEFFRKSIGKIVEGLSKKHNSKALDLHTQKINSPDQLYVYGVDTRSHKIEKKKIKCFIKTTPPKNWLKITTTTNRSFVVTPDHNILYLEGGKLKSTEACKLKAGMELPVCLNFPTPAGYPSRLNLVKLFCESGLQEKESIIIRSKEYFKKLYYQKRELLLKILQLNAGERKTPSRWYARVPLTHFELLVKSNLCSFDSLPNDAKIAMKRDDFELPITIPINHYLMTILGYYISEGYARESKTAYQVNFRICNKNMCNRLVAAIRNVFGIAPYLGENDTQVCISSRLIYLLFCKAWESGKNAHAKRVPKIVFSLDNTLVKTFISAYFDGDGSVVATPPRIHLYSVSKSLLEDLGTLMLRFGIFCRYGSSKPRLPGKRVLERYAELGKEPGLFSLSYISLYGKDIRKFANICNPSVKHKADRILTLRETLPHTQERFIKYENSFYPVYPQSDYLFDKIKSIETLTEALPAYCLDVEGDTLEDKNVLLNNQILTIRCDGDEDCVMLLMDALINFSRKYLYESRGGTMDTPLVLSMEINPKEVDDEAHNIEFVSHYSLEFYEAGERFTPPGEIKIKTVKDVLGTEEQYELPITHPGGTIDVGNVRTAYVELQSVPDKIDVQFSLQGRLRAVDKRDAAERLILSHFIPDLYGNLRSFSRQTFRCVACNHILRRVSLAGKCPRCGGNLLLTINKGGIEKYLEISHDIVRIYDLPLYLKQRLELVEREIKSIFEDDKVKQMGLSDFL